MIFQCPLEKIGARSNPPSYVGYTDYWMNSRLAGRSQGLLADAAWTFVNGDGNDGTSITNAGYALGSIPTTWVGNTGSPLYRHLEGANLWFY